MSEFLRQESGKEWIATIPSGQSKSGEIPTSERGPRGIAVLIPSAWTAADIGIEVSNDKLNWFPLEDSEGTRIKLTSVPTSAAARPVRAFPAGAWVVGTFTYMRLTSISTSNEDTEVNQAAARTFFVVPLL